MQLRAASSSDPPCPRRIAARGSLLEVRNREREERGEDSEAQRRSKRKREEGA